MNTSNAKTATTSNGRTSTTTNHSMLSDLDLSELCDESVLQLLDEPFNLEDRNAPKLRKDAHYTGFDGSTGNTWIYPTNYQIRQYQFNITQAALFKNTLVVLPTGLGKTFIAAVVMYNIFRWYPTGKIIFMAPTRPLVAQQIDACYQIMGIPKEDTIELTGKQNKRIRSTAWHSKRVFFVTPQVVWSDINDPEINFPISEVKLIVVDEAHKAKGKYAYTDVVSSIAARNKMFRILALSATPGRTIKDVVEVVQNLLISHVEVRSERSIDVAPYTFKKNIKTVVVQLDDNLRKIRDDFLELLEPYVTRLQEYNVITGHLGNLSKGWLLMEKNRYRDNVNVQRHPQHSKIMTDFCVCISMYHGLELLERHGIRVFLNYFDDNTDGEKEKYFVMTDGKIRDFLDKLRSFAGPNPFAAGDTTLQNNISMCDDLTDFDCGHPKFKILQTHLVEHFQGNENSRCIIFCEFRESVFLLFRILRQCRPLVKPKAFVGQGSSKTGTVTQKEQIAIMNNFRSGVCNTLIATCVAEEGIDVGEVDLIICFDVTNKNPTRFVQRIGRTGRKRQGKVIMLVTEGKEQTTLKGVLATKDETNQRINKSPDVERALYRQCPRLVPPEFRPQCVETFIQIRDNPIAEPEIITTRSKKKTSKEPAAKKPPVRKGKTTAKPPKTTMKMRNMREFFKPVDFDEVELEVFEAPNTSNTSNLENELSILNDSLRNNSADLAEVSVIEDNAEPAVRENSTIPRIPFAVKVAKLIERYHSVKNSSRNVPSSSEARLRIIITQDSVPNQLKLDVLKKNREFVEKFTEGPLTNSDPDVRKCIEQIFSGKRKVRQFLKEKPEKWSDMSPSNQEAIFQILTQLRAPISNNSFVVDQPAPEPQFIANTQVDYFIDTESNLPVFFENESRYESQRHPSQVNNKHFAGTLSSTPIKKATSKVAKNKSLIDSPIAKAFERCNRKNNIMNENLRPTVSTVHSTKTDSLSEASDRPALKNQNYLQYLGLTCLDDLFADDDETSDEAVSAKDVEEDSFVKPAPLQTMTTDRIDNHSHIGEPSKILPINKEISDIFVDSVDEIPGTQNVIDPEVSSIRSQRSMKKNISNQNDVGMVSSASSDKENISDNRSLFSGDPPRKKLFIGTVNDMFAYDSDSDDEVQPKEDTITKSDETIPKSDSDCTQEYDFDEIIYNSSQLGEGKANHSVTNGTKGDGEFAKLILSLEAGSSVMRNGGPIGRNDSEDIFAMSDSSKSNKSASYVGLEHKESDHAIVVTQRSSSPPTFSKNMPNTTKSLSLIATSSTSFIGKAEANPCVRTSSPKDNSHRFNNSRLPSVPSVLNVYSSGLGVSVNSKHDHISKTSTNTSNVRLTPSVFDSPPRNSSTHADSLQEMPSPSLIRRGPNLSRLRYKVGKEPSLNSEKNVFGSPQFLTCKPTTNSGSTSNYRSPDDFEQPQNIQSKLDTFQYKPTVSYVSDSRMGNVDSQIFDEDEAFATCKSLSSNQSGGQKRKLKKSVKKNPKRKKCQFLDDEAVVSGDDSEDEEEDDFFTQGIIDYSQHDQGDPNVDMHAKYLESIRSPLKNNRFKIPEPGYRHQVPISNIFSQVIRPGDISEFVEDSFLVRSDDAEEESEAEMSELERAEMILKEKRRQKRKMKDNDDAGNSKRRRRIITMNDSTDSE